MSKVLGSFEFSESCCKDCNGINELLGIRLVLDDRVISGRHG